MVTITITKREYENLVEKKLYFDYMQALMKEKSFLRQISKAQKRYRDAEPQKYNKIS